MSRDRLLAIDILAKFPFLSQIQCARNLNIIKMTASTDGLHSVGCYIEKRLLLFVLRLFYDHWADAGGLKIHSIPIVNIFC